MINDSYICIVRLIIHKNQTPLHLAEVNGHQKIVEKLLNSDPSITVNSNIRIHGVHEGRRGMRSFHAICHRIMILSFEVKVIIFFLYKNFLMITRKKMNKILRIVLLKKRRLIVWFQK